MTEAKSEIMQMEYQNPYASKPLYIPIQVLCNTPDEELRNNVKINSARNLEWLKQEEAHEGVAVMVGGGASVADYPGTIVKMQREGATVFAMNGASKWLGKKGISVDYQCILDAKKENLSLVDPDARTHLFASQCHPEVLESVPNPIVWHIGTDNIEDDFPPEKVKAGGYALVGGGSGVGNSAVCAAYALGYRTFHIFGFDSCHRDGKSHAYDQPMNRFIPNVQVTWGDRVFTASVAMKVHAERFQVTSQKLKQLGCDLHVYGDGLLQAMYNTKPENLTERDKYKTLWQFDRYRAYSPGLDAVPLFLNHCSPGKEDIIIDFGCGSGKASVKLKSLGYDVFLVDFADNCRDEEAISLPFLVWDLTHPLPVSSPFGLCCDVMEHVPPNDVDAVVTNIMEASETVFFQISTIDDAMGDIIGAPLHLTVISGAAWMAIFYRLGYNVSWHHIEEGQCQFVVKN